MEEKKYFSLNQIFVHNHGFITDNFLFLFFFFSFNTNAQLNMPCSLYNLERLLVLRGLFNQGNYSHNRYATLLCDINFPISLYVIVSRRRMFDIGTKKNCRREIRHNF